MFWEDTWIHKVDIGCVNNRVIYSNESQVRHIVKREREFRGGGGGITWEESSQSSVSFFFSIQMDALQYKRTCRKRYYLWQREGRFIRKFFRIYHWLLIYREREEEREKGERRKKKELIFSRELCHVLILWFSC